MQLDFEYLPATQQAQQELVLLHGWGSNREIWRPLLMALRSWANITLVDIPACAPGLQEPLDPGLAQTLAAILECTPGEAVYVGWSLGGQLAVELATREPQRVSALVTICCNPRFVAAAPWPGMGPASFAEFRTSMEADPVASLRRFDSLQVQGARNARHLLRQLPRHGRDRSCGHLLTGLDWLYELDQRAALPLLTQAQLHLVGEVDGLVPAGLEGALRGLLQDTPRAQVQLVPGASHLAPLDSCDFLAAEIKGFLASAGLLSAANAVAKSLAKQDVAESFSRAASHYDSVAGLQRDVGAKLLRSLEPLSANPSTVLDLGCGTGYFSKDLQRCYPGATHIGLDLAQGMVEYARSRNPESEAWLVGDAEALPLAANSVDLIFSSLAIQWCARPQHLFAELARVLRPAGRCVFTSLGPDTLCELRAAWAAVDSHQHVNTFLAPVDLQRAALSVPGVRLELQCERYRMQYERVRELLFELKTLGAHNMNRDRPTGLTSRGALQGMLQAYEAWRDGGLLPATYDVIFGVMEKA